MPKNLGHRARHGQSLPIGAIVKVHDAEAVLGYLDELPHRLEVPPRQLRPVDQREKVETNFPEVSRVNPTPCVTDTG